MIPLFKVAMHPSAGLCTEKTLHSGYIGQGPRVEELESRLSSLFGRPHVLTTNSCTSALDLALHLCDVGPGDYVITTPLTCTATNGVIVRRHAIPVWADVLPNGILSPESVRASIERLPVLPKAIMVVAWGGLYPQRLLYPADIPVICDSAHCFSWECIDDFEYQCFSFQAIKFLTTGDGGALLCRSEADHERARLLRWYGLDRRSSADFRCAQDITEIGYKYHMNDVAAAIGLANFDMALQNVAMHRRNATLLGATAPGDYWVYFLQPQKRSEFQHFMAHRGIETSLVHRRNDQHTAFAAASRLGHRHLAELNAYCDKYVAVPCGWWLTDDDLRKIKEAIGEYSRLHGPLSPPSRIGS